MPNTLKKLFLATIGVIALAAGSPASAAGGDARCALGRFQGFYAGGHVGGTSHDTTWVDRDAWVDNFTVDWALGSVNRRNGGFSGGLQAGHNWQPGCTVFGIEIDWSFADLDDKRTYRPTAGPGTVLTLDTNVNGYGTLRARGGVVVDSLLLYLTGGAAYANIKHTWRIDDPFTARERFSSTGNRWGGAGGVGAEWAITPNLSVKAEGIYLRFSDRKKSGFSPAGPETVHFDIQDSFWVGRVGLHYKFWP